MIVLLVAVAVLSFYRLGAGSLWDQDETKYAQIAREILETGDPITLHVNGRPWYVHPPLYMWLVAATGGVAGFSEFSVRAWSAAFSVLTVCATMLLGQAWFGPRVGVLAGAILAVTFQFMAQSRLAVFDTVLLAWMLLAVYAFVRGHRGERGQFLWFFIYAGLATFSKGPIGLLLPGLVIVPFVLIRRAWTRWREVPWIAGFAVYVLIGLSWYGVETWLHGADFVRRVFGYYGIGRFFGVVEDQAGPWTYYLPVLFAGAFPWTAFWPAAAAYHARRRADDGSLFVVLWCAIVFVFYSIAATKLPNYVLPIYPLAAIGVAAWWEAAARGETGRALPVSAACLAVLLTAFYAGIGGYLRNLYPREFHELGHILVGPAIVMAAGVALVIGLVIARRPLAAAVALCAAVAVAWLGVLTWILPVIEAQKPMKPLATAIHAVLQPGDRIVGYRMSIYSSLIYYTDHPVEWVDTPADLRRAVCNPGRVFVVLTEQAAAANVGVLPRDIRPFAGYGQTLVLEKRAAAVCAPF